MVLSVRTVIAAESERRSTNDERRRRRTATTTNDERRTTTNDERRHSKLIVQVDDDDVVCAFARERRTTNARCYRNAATDDDNDVVAPLSSYDDSRVLLTHSRYHGQQLRNTFCDASLVVCRSCRCNDSSQRKALQHGCTTLLQHWFVPPALQKLCDVSTAVRSAMILSNRRFATRLHINSLHHAIARIFSPLLCSSFQLLCDVWSRGVCHTFL